jgi:hypothetical protein
LIERKVAKERGFATEIATRINGMTLQFERQRRRGREAVRLGLQP